MTKPYFLYADSNMSDKNCLEKVLCEFGPSQSYISVNNGFQLIQFLQTVKYGETYPYLIILSELMQRLDGLTTLELLKSDDIYCLIPVVILCSADSIKDPKLYAHLGAEVIKKASDMTGWKRVAKEICEYVH